MLTFTTMKIPVYQIDAFTRGPFSGNPAAVCPLKNWPSDELLQSIAMENNLSETAFFTNDGDHFTLRWFTPVTEVDLCGHATLASAFVLYEVLGYEGSSIRFESRSGELTVSRKGSQFELNFPSDSLETVKIDPVFVEGLGKKPTEMYKGRSDWMCVFKKQSDIENLSPDFRILSRAGGRGVIVTAPGDNMVDFVSRCFYPKTGVDEDPATGSAHTSMTPYWSSVLGKKSLTAVQLSMRKGYFSCTSHGDRVLISGACELFMKGEISISGNTGPLQDLM